jgi:hypothetical protein
MGETQAIDDTTDAETWQENVSDKTTTFKLRHERSTRTHTIDGELVHEIVESYDDDAPAESLTFKAKTECPIDDHTTTRELDDDGVVRYQCDTDSCAYQATVKRRYDERTNTEAPTFYRAVVPDHGVENDGTIDFADTIDGEDEDDVELLANAVRVLTLGRYVGGVDDKAHVSAERDDDMNVVEDAYIDTLECSKCGVEIEAPAARRHAHFGDVCVECEDATVWSPDDAELPDDVVDRMNDHKTFSRSNIVAFLRDVAFYGDFVAAVTDDEDAGGFDGIKTGEQGKRDAHALGRGRKGTGFRRPNGAAHGKRHFRTVLRDLADTDLLERTDDADTDVDDPSAYWKLTEKGRGVLVELARCKTCGDAHDVFVRHSMYKAGRRTKHSKTLTIGCEACDHSSPAVGAFVLESSNQTEYHKIASVDDVVDE